jgi:hypothetical protein
MSKVKLRINKKYKMKGVTWNGRGMWAAHKRKHARELVCDHDMYYIGIQETQLEDFKDIWLDQIGYMQDFFWYVLPSQGRSEGIFNK